jgi:hypothetical protein
MIFVYTVSRQALFIYASLGEAQVQRDCDAQDDLLFFATDGSPLRLQDSGDGIKFLRPWASCGSCHLAQVLPYVQQVSGDALFDSPEAVRLHLGL